MSDFDKEAEREKLRQQYEADQQERKATQRMSELLLQGATMTGKHCDTCGDPIFRQNGTEFCPTCQQQQPAEESPEEASDEGATAEGTSQTADDGSSEVEAAETSGQPARVSQPQEPPRQPRRSPPSQTDDSRGRGSAPRQSEPHADTGHAEVGTGDLAEARDALVRKLTRLAQEAEATDDVGRAREQLAATREAAEALAALDRVRR